MCPQTRQIKKTTSPFLEGVVALLIFVYSASASAQWGSQITSKVDAWEPDSQWTGPLSWLEAESAKSRPAMRGVMLPTEFKHVGDFLNMGKFPMAVQYQKDLRIGGGPPIPSCVIGREGTYGWKGWLDIAKTEKEREWVRFWLVAHEWGHCLEVQERGVQPSEPLLEELQNGERRADAFATIALVARTGAPSWFLRIASARRGDPATAVHHTYPVFEAMVGEDVATWGGQSVDQWWQVAKRLTEKSRPPSTKN